MTPQNYRPTWAVKLGMVSTAPEQGRARPSWEEDRVAREAGGPVRQDRGDDSLEVQGTAAWVSRRAVGAAAGLDEGCASTAGWPRAVKAAEEL